MMEAYLGWRDPLSQALDRRYHNPEWLDWMVMNGRAHLIATERAAGVAEIVYYPTGAKDLKGICAAGELGEIVEVIIPQFAVWGKRMGCVALLVDSREGWTRILKNQGFALYRTAMRKAL